MPRATKRTTVSKDDMAGSNGAGRRSARVAANAAAKRAGLENDTRIVSELGELTPPPSEEEGLEGTANEAASEADNNTENKADRENDMKNDMETDDTESRKRKFDAHDHEEPRSIRHSLSESENEASRPSPPRPPKRTYGRHNRRISAGRRGGVEVQTTPLSSSSSLSSDVELESSGDENEVEEEEKLEEEERSELEEEDKDDLEEEEKDDLEEEEKKGVEKEDKKEEGEDELDEEAPLVSEFDTEVDSDSEIWPKPKRRRITRYTGPDTPSSLPNGASRASVASEESHGHGPQGQEAIRKGQTDNNGWKGPDKRLRPRICGQGQAGKDLWTRTKTRTANKSKQTTQNKTRQTRTQTKTQTRTP